MRVAEFFAVFSIKPDRKSIADVRDSIASVRRMILGLGTAVAGGSLIKSFVSLNSEAQDVKNQIAGTLALAKNTTLSSELANASNLYSEIRKKAASLPGTTLDYAKALGFLAFPLTQAGFSSKELVDISANAVVATKALNVQTQAGLRDIDQALRGQLRSVDVLTTKLLANTPWNGEKGRKAFNALSKERRAQIIRDALTQKQIVEMANAQADSFTGRADKLRDQLQQLIMQVGGPLFAALGDAIKDATTWLEEHKDTVQSVADTIAGVLKDAFEILREVFGWLIDHGDLVKDILWGVALALGAIGARSALLWLVAKGPFLKLVGLATIAKEIFDALKDKIGSVGAALVAAFSVLAINKLISRVGDLSSALLGLGRTAGTVSAAGAAINGGALAGGLGPAGAGSAAASGAGALGALGPIGLALAGGYGLSELTGGPLDIQAMIAEVSGGRLVNGLGGGNVTKTINAPNVTIDARATIAISGTEHEVNEELRKIMDEREQSMLRHVDAALSGGSRH